MLLAVLAVLAVLRCETLARRLTAGKLVWLVLNGAACTGRPLDGTPPVRDVWLALALLIGFDSFNLMSLASDALITPCVRRKSTWLEMLLMMKSTYASSAMAYAFSVGRRR